MKLPECEESANEAGPLSEGSSSALLYEKEMDLQEALENFRAYLSILREWNQKERLKADDPTDQDEQVSIVDRELGKLV